ncbi:MAG: hypothetical protein RLZZ387_1172, partial [Chloroflexota bacterium]
ALVGEVVNATNAPVCYARVTARLYNADGVLVATDDRGADLTATLPGQRNPFTVWIYDAPPASRYELSVSADSCYSRYASLTVVSAADRNVNGGVEVFGEVENTGGDAVTSAEVAITYYGADGRVVQTDWDLVSPDDLVLGQRGTYRAVTYVRNLRQLFTRYTITAQARVASGPFVIHKESVRPTRPPVTTEWQRRP